MLGQLDALAEAGIVPEKMGSLEPRAPYSRDAAAALLPAWCDLSLPGSFGANFIRRRSKLLLSVNAAHGLSSFVDTGLSLDSNEAHDRVAAVSAIVQHASRAPGCEHAYAHVVMPDDAVRGRAAGVVFGDGRVVRMSYAIPSRLLRGGLPELSWLTYVGPDLTEKIGREVILRIPAFRTWLSERGGVWVQLTESIEDCVHDPKSVADIRERAKRAFPAGVFPPPQAVPRLDAMHVGAWSETTHDESPQPITASLLENIVNDSGARARFIDAVLEGMYDNATLVDDGTSPAEIADGVGVGTTANGVLPAASESAPLSSDAAIAAFVAGLPDDAAARVRVLRLGATDRIVVLLDV